MKIRIRQESEAEQDAPEAINYLIKNYRKRWGKERKLAAIKEPLLLLLMENREIKVLEGVGAGKLTYEGTDGRDKDLYLNQSQLYTLEYGKDTVRTYVADERLPFAYPQDPIVYADMFKMAIDKIANDYRMWEASLLKARSHLWWVLLGSLALVIVAAAFAYMIYQSGQPPEPAAAAQAVAAATQNATVFR